MECDLVEFSVGTGKVIWLWKEFRDCYSGVMPTCVWFQAPINGLGFLYFVSWTDEARSKPGKTSSNKKNLTGELSCFSVNNVPVRISQGVSTFGKSFFLRCEFCTSMQIHAHTDCRNFDFFPKAQRLSKACAWECPLSCISSLFSLKLTGCCVFWLYGPGTHCHP